MMEFAQSVQAALLCYVVVMIGITSSALVLAPLGYFRNAASEEEAFFAAGSVEWILSLAYAVIHIAAFIGLRENIKTQPLRVNIGCALIVCSSLAYIFYCSAGVLQTRLEHAFGATTHLHNGLMKSEGQPEESATGGGTCSNSPVTTREILSTALTALSEVGRAIFTPLPADEANKAAKTLDHLTTGVELLQHRYLVALNVVGFCLAFLGMITFDTPDITAAAVAMLKREEMADKRTKETKKVQ